MRLLALFGLIFAVEGLLLAPLVMPAHAQQATLSNGWTSYTTPISTDQTQTPLSLDSLNNLRTLSAGFATTSAPAYGNNTPAPLSLDAHGNLRVSAETKLNTPIGGNSLVAGTYYIVSTVPGTLFEYSFASEVAGLNGFRLYDNPTTPPVASCNDNSYVKIYSTPATSVAFSYNFPVLSAGAHFGTGLTVCASQTWRFTGIFRPD